MVTMLGTPSKLTIFEDGAGDAPFNDPVNNLSLVKFDSTFQYLPNLPARTLGPINYTLPGDLGSVRSRTIIVGAHGQPGVPFVYGMLRFTAGASTGLVIPMVGSVAVRGPGAPAGNMITWTLGVDATNVFIVEERSSDLDFGATPGREVTVYVFDKLAA